jgi:hypothetical protein
LCRVDKADRLLTKHPLVEVPVKEGVGDVELPRRPSAPCNQGDHGANLHGLDHKRERLAEVDS